MYKIALMTLAFTLPTLATADLNINYAPPSGSQFVEISPSSAGELAGSVSAEAAAYRSLLQKEYGSAAKQFYKLVQAKGQQPNLLYGLALSYQKSNNKPAAINVWQHLLANPSATTAMKAYAHLNLASLQPQNADTLNNIAQYAVNSAETSAIYATMGNVLLQQGQKEQGLRSLELAYQQTPQNILYAYNLAVAYDQHGNKEKALPLYKAVSENNGIATKLSANALNTMRKRIAFLMK